MLPFLWGVGTSSHQIDGNNVHSDWWQWELEGNIEGGVSSGRATDHWNRFKEDLELAASLGLTSYRFSIEWARIEPVEGEWDESAISWYHDLIAECERQGLVPMATLHHFTLPLWVAEKGGFAWDGCTEKFARYVRKVVQNFGARIPLWVTINEPMALVVGKFLGSFMPPAKYSPELASIHCRNLLIAHVQAYDILHKEMPERRGPWKDYPVSVGIAHNMVDFVPMRRWHPLETFMTGLFRRFYNRSWLDAITGRQQHFGVHGLVPYPEPVVEALGRKTADFMGVNYYTKIYVCCHRPHVGFGKSDTLRLGVNFFKKNDRVSDLGWTIHPSGLGRMIRFVKRYGLPIIITENGIADREDKLRPDYLVSHLRQVAHAIGRGADIRGYYHWSLLDNFEWVKGFDPRFGLIEVDYSTFKRTLRPSALLYKKIIRDHKRRANRMVPQSWLLKHVALDPHPNEILK